jgi:phospholipid/cholesterol/gamma-HCH transport system ATP-binding protein
VSPVPKLSLESVDKRFSGRAVLDGVSLSVAEGEAVAVMGPSGTGKSVLLKHCVGLLQPDAGTVRIDGQDFWRLAEREQMRMRQRFGVAFQEGALFDSMSVFDNIAFPLRRHRYGEAQVRARVRECLALVRLTGVEDQRPSQLSVGMRRRAGFARAIALEPRTMLFDEPTAGLDPIMVTVMVQVIRSLTTRLRCTTVLVTHDLRTARGVADRIALLANGRIVVDAPADAFAHLTQPEVQQFVEGRPDGPLTPADVMGGAA